MKKILLSFVLLLGIGNAQSGCPEDPFCRPEFAKGRFNAYGQDYVLSVPKAFLDFNMSYEGESDWRKPEEGGRQKKDDPSQFYFKNVGLNYRWDNLEPWDGRNDTYRAKQIHLATKIVQMDVTSHGRKLIPQMIEEEYRIALDEERKFRHNSLSYYIHQLTNYVDWSNEENSKLIERLQSINLDVARTPSIMVDRSSENILTSEQFKKISTYQEDSKLYHFPYTHINPYGRKTNKTDYYWFIDDIGIVTDYIVCTFNIREESPPRCKLITSIPEKKLLVEISFSGWHLKEWQQIKNNSLKLLNGFITKAELE